jgi:hypothetical protein
VKIALVLHRFRNLPAKKSVRKVTKSENRLQQQQTETYSDSDIFSASTSARRALTGLDELFGSCLFTV